MLVLNRVPTKPFVRRPQLPKNSLAVYEEPFDRLIPVERSYTCRFLTVTDPGGLPDEQKAVA